MGHKKYILVGYVEAPYEHPHRTLWNQLFFCRFLCSFWWNILPGIIIKITIFNMAAMKKLLKNEKWEFLQILTITDKQNLHINAIDENYNEIS